MACPSDRARRGATVSGGTRFRVDVGAPHGIAIRSILISDWLSRSKRSRRCGC